MLWCSRMNLGFQFHLTVAASLAAVAVWSWTRRLKARKEELPFDDIPYVVPSPHWLVGHLFHLGKDVIEGQRKLCQTHAGGHPCVSTFWTFGTPVFTTLDASLATRILKFTSQRRNNPAILRHVSRLFGQNSIIVMNGKRWKANREIIERSFSKSSMQRVQAHFDAVAHRLRSSVSACIRQSDNNRFLIDLLILSRMAVLDCFGLAALGHDFGCTKGGFSESEIFQLLGHIQREFTRRCFHDRLSLSAQFYNLPVLRNIRLRQSNHRLRQILMSIIEDKRAALKSSSETNADDLLSRALADTHNGGLGDDEAVSSWLIASLIGGSDTTSLALTSAIYFIAKNSRIQSECHLEARQQTETSTASDSPYIQACFWEALRFYPPTPVTARTLDREFKFNLDGREVTLPSGARCMISIYWIHHSSLNFEQPDEFIPERWVEKCPTTDCWISRTTGDDKMLAFSAGARSCVGRAFATRLVPTLLRLLLANYHFVLDEPDPKLTFVRCGTSMAPAEPINVIIKPRKR